VDDAVGVFALAEEGHPVVPASLDDGLLVRTRSVVDEVARVAGRPVFVGSQFLNGLLEITTVLLSRFGNNSSTRELLLKGNALYS
jgi:hypothetical protein